MNNHNKTLNRMFEQKKSYYLINEFSDSRKKRVLVLLFALLVNYSALYLINPYVRSLIEPLFKSLDPAKLLFIKHLLFYSLIRALLCAAMIIVLVKIKIFRIPSLKRNIKKAFISGTVLGITIVILSVLHMLLTGGSLNFDFNALSFTGNLFSNAYEEIIYRGLILSAILYSFCSPAAAVIFSGLIFGFSHSQYGFGEQLGVSVVGAALSGIYYFTGNLIAPLTAHQISDVIVMATLDL